MARLRSGEEILELCGNFECELDAINIATAIHRLAKLHIPGMNAQASTADLLLRKAVVASSRDFGPQALANSAWSLATLAWDGTSVL